MAATRLEDRYNGPRNLAWSPAGDRIAALTLRRTTLPPRPQLRTPLSLKVKCPHLARSSASLPSGQKVVSCLRKYFLVRPVLLPRFLYVECFLEAARVSGTAHVPFLLQPGLSPRREKAAAASGWSVPVHRDVIREQRTED